MIISRTPLRVSFVGGGTDLPDFAEEHGGAVVSTAIDKWIDVVVRARFEGDVRVSYSRTEVVEQSSDLEHELVREALRVSGLPRALEVITLADVPSRGTGMGSSSTLLVGLLNALYAFQGVYRPPLELAELAARIEIDDLGKPIGRQDHYAAAAGGLNLIEFVRGGGTRVEPIVAPPGTIQQLHRSLILFYTGRQRSASGVLANQREAIRDGRATQALGEMRDLAYAFRDALGAGDLATAGELLHANWELKRKLAPDVSDEAIDGWYAAAREAGAAGGKLLGAGAGGFLLIFADPERQPAVRAALDGHLREVPFSFAAHGTRIMYLDREQ